ncbi:MAG: LysM peptidoglycan-binding domain-containing protein, partial [Kiritimatiellae bacterium]|nr:LysM peptidoglycan-binding domain-containing protein [Kiritimatiellia bacterium]
PPASAEAPQPSVAVPPPDPALASLPDALRNRPVKARNLLMRLAEAEKARDMEMAITTIEQLRALPGSPVADLDDRLARRLGELNMLRLFEGRSGQWVKSVTVKRGDSASRIAAENGSTLASLARLNGGNVDRIVLGRSLYVMDHPRFNLAIRRRTRTADLSLNGKFFRRYDLAGADGGKDGAYEMTATPRAFWRAVGVEFRPEDRAELELLLPVGARVLVSEL